MSSSNIIPQPQKPYTGPVHPDGTPATLLEASTLMAITAKAMTLGVAVKPVNVITPGTRVTLYRLRPDGRTRAAHIEGIAQDIAMQLGCVEKVHIHPIIGESAVGVYVPHSKELQKVLSWQELVGKAASSDSKIPLVLGADWLGTPFVDDLTTLPHLCIAGSTGGGKSVLLRSLAASIVCLKDKENVQLVLSDTKGVEFSDFDGCPHLYFGKRSQTVTRTIHDMQELVRITDERLMTFSQMGVRNIHEANQAFSEKPDSILMPLPYIVLMIDELADIVEESEKDGRRTIYPGADALDYLTRKARAAGIHVIAATQRPSVDVVAGVVKNNFLARLTFRMPSSVDSKVILDETGAEQLMQTGDMLYKSPNFNGNILRLHAGWATSTDIRAMIEYAVFKQLGMGHDVPKI